MSIIRVNVLTTYNSPNSLALNYPLLIHRPFFIKKGIRFYFYDRLSDRIHDCDVIFINSKFFKRWHSRKTEELYDVLRYFKKRVQRVTWFDTNDSSGTTQFNIMPFVDSYYKSQILKDSSLYTRPFYGYRIFTDYCARKFGITDEIQSSSKENPEIAVSTLLQKEHAHKLRVSWNSAMNEWGRYNYLYGGLIGRMRSRFSFKTVYKVRFFSAGKNRKIDINGRIGLSHPRNTVRYQRERITGILKEKFNVDVRKIPRRQYLDELRNSKIGISPFGLGEISCRDFEIIINGALLFKQDMSHLETWPPLYVNNETYVPFSWDLKDFEERLRELLKDRQRIIGISKKAQELYAYYLYGDGRLEFCDKVLSIIGK